MDDAYDEKNVINNILPHHTFISKYGCLSNHINQSEHGTDKSDRKTNKRPRTNDAGQQTAIDGFYSDTHACLNSNKWNNAKCIKTTMDARMIDNIEMSNPSAEVTELITQWREIVEPGIYRMTGGR